MDEHPAPPVRPALRPPVVAELPPGRRLLPKFWWHSEFAPGTTLLARRLAQQRWAFLRKIGRMKHDPDVVEQIASAGSRALAGMATPLGFISSTAGRPPSIDAPAFQLGALAAKSRSDYPWVAADPFAAAHGQIYHVHATTRGTAAKAAAVDHPPKNSRKKLHGSAPGDRGGQIQVTPSTVTATTHDHHAITRS